MEGSAAQNKTKGGSESDRALRILRYMAIEEVDAWTGVRVVAQDLMLGSDKRIKLAVCMAIRGMLDATASVEDAGIGTSRKNIVTQASSFAAVKCSTTSSGGGGRGEEQHRRGVLVDAVVPLVECLVACVVSVHPCVCVFIYVCVCVCIYMTTTYTQLHTHIHIHTYIHTHIHIHTATYTHTHVHTHIHIHTTTCTHIHTHTQTRTQSTDGKDDDKGRKLPTLLTTSALDCCLLVFHHVSIHAMHAFEQEDGEGAQHGVPKLLELNTYMQRALGVMCAWYAHRKPLLVEGVSVVMGTLDACARAGSQVMRNACVCVCDACAIFCV
jgi:hypothetical protein